MATDSLEQTKTSTPNATICQPSAYAEAGS